MKANTKNTCSTAAVPNFITNIYFFVITFGILVAILLIDIR